MQVSCGFECSLRHLVGHCEMQEAGLGWTFSLIQQSPVRAVPISHLSSARIFARRRGRRLRGGHQHRSSHAANGYGNLPLLGTRSPIPARIAHRPPGGRHNIRAPTPHKPLGVGVPLLERLRVHEDGGVRAKVGQPGLVAPQSPFQDRGIRWRV